LIDWKRFFRKSNTQAGTQARTQAAPTVPSRLLSMCCCSGSYFARQATSLFFLIVPITHIDHSTMTLHQTEMESLQNKELPAMTESDKQWNVQREQPVEFEQSCCWSI
jgi:hypothetical protein